MDGAGLQHQLDLPRLRPPALRHRGPLPIFGEAWHNNHHAFPTSARHGLGRWQLDPSAAVIRTLEACGPAWHVVGVGADRQERKTIAPAQASET